MSQWVIAHQSSLIPLATGVGIAVLDFVFAVNDKAKSNGLLHWIYTVLKKRSGVIDQPPGA